MTWDVEAIAARVRQAMEARGMNMHGLEHAANLPNSYVGKFLRLKRRDVAAETLYKLATALRVPLDWLVSGAGDPPMSVQHPPDPCPNRTEAARLLVDDGEMTEAVAGKYNIGSPGPYRDRKVLWWVRRIREDYQEYGDAGPPRPSDPPPTEPQGPRSFTSPPVSPEKPTKRSP